MIRGLSGKLDNNELAAMVNELALLLAERRRRKRKPAKCPAVSRRGIAAGRLISTTQLKEKSHE